MESMKRVNCNDQTHVQYIRTNYRRKVDQAEKEGNNQRIDAINSVVSNGYICAHYEF